MIPISEQYRINIKNAIELIDNTLKLVERSNVVLTSTFERYQKRNSKKTILSDFRGRFLLGKNGKK
jgi:hypothetical protein